MPIDKNISFSKTTTNGNTVPFEIEETKKLKYYKNDYLFIDLAELEETNPVDFSDLKKINKSIFR
jgi:hypothetical protein